MKTLTVEDVTMTDCRFEDCAVYGEFNMATHRAVSVETLKVLRALVSTIPEIEKYKGTGGYIGPALAEIEEVLRDA